MAGNQVWKWPGQDTSPIIARRLLFFRWRIQLEVRREMFPLDGVEGGEALQSSASVLTVRINTLR